MQSPKKTVTLMFRNVPENKVKAIKQYVYRIKYQEDEKDAIAYKMIEDNPSAPLGELQKRLRNEYGLQKTLRKLKLIATECGLPYTE